jgi:hypothetical protein
MTDNFFDFLKGRYRFMKSLEVIKTDRYYNLTITSIVGAL